MGLRVAVFGASGYAGGELVRLLDGHAGFDTVYLGAHTKAGGVLGDVHPHLANGDRPLGPNHPEETGPIDLAFLALPHGASAHLGRELATAGVKVVDLGSDFRLDTPERYAEAYGSTHPFPDELGGWRYGLPELFDLEGADRVASPGCYPTAVLLAVAPLVRAGMAAATDIVADCLSGVSGAGRSLREDLLFGEVAEGVRSYAVAVHRHRPEIEMGLDLFCQSRSRVTFTPHLVPIQRGLLATVTCRMTRDLTRSDLLDALRDQYRDRPLVEVIDRPPQTRWVTGSGRALLSAFVDGDRGAIVAQAAIDNLGKGAAAQAVQAANLMVGFAEAEGLSGSGLLP